MYEDYMRDLFDDIDPAMPLRVRVTPKAKDARIKKVIAEDGRALYKVYVTVAAEDGKANLAVIELLAKAMGVPKTSLRITRGLTSREKIIQIVR